MPFTNSQLQAIIIVERVSSILSLLGAAFVITTFTLNPKFRKPINRLVFYATFGNIFSNVATLISRAGIESGLSSPLCQFQGFLIQWFMPADALWTCAMAFNVWLSFFQSYDTAALRRLEYKYVIACYGIPFIPAMVYLVIQTQERGKIYGSANLWCWVSLEWDFLRIATFYGPVWIVILCTIGIYVRVGAVILKWRRNLISIEKGIGTRETKDTRDESSFRNNGIVKTSEFTIMASDSYQSTSRPDSEHLSKKPSFPNSSDPRLGSNRSQVHRNGGIDPNKAAVKYCKCALLFFIALLVTWVPSTINRIHTIVHPTQSMFGLNVAAALVLPLQGFWNAIIYLATSTFAMQCLWEDVKDFCIRIKQSSTKIPTSEVPQIELDHQSSRLCVPHVMERISSQSGLMRGTR